MGSLEHGQPARGSTPEENCLSLPQKPSIARSSSGVGLMRPFPIQAEFLSGLVCAITAVSLSAMALLYQRMLS